MKKTSVNTELKRKTPRFFEIKEKQIYAYDKTVVFSEKEIGTPGAKYQIVSFPKGAKVAPHHHRKVREVFLVQSGEGKITVNGRKQVAKKGDVFLIEPRDSHALHNSGKKPFVLSIVKWDEDERDIFWD